MSDGSHARILGYGDRAVHEPAGRVLEDRVTRTRVAGGDPPEGVACRKGANPVRDAASFVPKVRSILQAKKWDIAEWFQTVWVNGYANQLVGKQSDGQGTQGPLTIVDVAMDWVLGFKRARDVFDEVVDPDVFANDKARALLMTRVEDKFREYGGQNVPLGDLTAKKRDLEREYINFRALGTSGGYYDASGGGSGSVYELDELTATLGRFALYVIPSGYANRSDESTEVTITKVGVFLRDSFDFNGEQFLGFWRQPDNISVTAPDDSSGRAGRYPRCSDDWFAMSNAEYRRYRERTGYGHDFLVYSDVKVKVLDEPVVFSFQSVAVDPTPQ